MSQFLCPSERPSACKRQGVLIVSPESDDGDGYYSAEVRCGTCGKRGLMCRRDLPVTRRQQRRKELAA